MPIVADAAVKIGADFSTFGSELERGTKSPIQSLGARIKGALLPQNLAIGAAALGGVVVAGLAGAVKSLIDIERLNAQTDAAIRSTGGVANVSRQGIEELSESMESLTTIERETVQEGANMLLTFTKVRNEVGKGNDIFDQATKAALDMSVALGTDATSAAMLLGKALNDPVKGMTAMTRAGIQFTAQQKAMIEQMVEAGDILGAQKIILAELETQFGGSAEAFANTTAGRIQRFQNDVGNMFESIIVGATKVADAIGGTADVVGEHFDNVGKGIEIIGDIFVGANAEYTESAIATADTLEDEYQRGAQGVRAGMAAAANEIERGGPVIAEQAGRVAGMLPFQIRERDREIRDAAMGNMIAMAMGFLDAQNEPKVAMEALTRLQEEEMDRATEIAYLKALWFDHQLAAGLQDGRPGVSTAADAVTAIIASRLAELGVDAWSFGNIITDEMAKGMYYGIPVVEGAARGVASAVGRQIGIRSEPEAPDSPLRGITKWGGNIVKTVAGGIYDELGAGRSAAGALAGALRPVLGVPALGGGTAGTAGGGGPTFILQVEGQPPFVGSRDDVLDRWQQMTSFTKEGVQ